MNSREQAVVAASRAWKIADDKAQGIADEMTRESDACGRGEGSGMDLSARAQDLRSAQFEASRLLENLGEQVALLDADAAPVFLPSMHSVESSNVKAVGFDSNSDTLFVEFHGGAIYEYVGVELQLFGAFLTAPSPGKFFNSTVKNGGYICKKRRDRS